MKKCYYNKKGYVVLITVLLVGAVGLSIAISIILLGLGQARTGATVNQLNQARALANTCAEEGLQQIRDLDSFTGTDTLTLDNGTCEYTVINQGGDNREIQASGTVGQINRKIKVNTDSISPTINITSWQEVSDF
ncbi:MAG: hypothetical protein Q7T50_05160 [Candidatus Magasanikbacteria bacterium]|nr:hypothetical protein [Candidatus Magasanikbacteria bacterium]